MSFIRKVPHLSETSPDEFIGRYVTNALGAQEIVVMKQIQWDYLDWLKSRGAQVEEFIIACDKRNPHMSLSLALEHAVYQAFQEREREGYPKPSWLDKSNNC